MKYNELFTDAASGPFTTVFSTDYADVYAAIFGDIDPKLIDLRAIVAYGNRVLIEPMTADNYKDIVSSVIALNAAQWKKQAAAMTAEYDALKPTVLSVETTDTNTLTETDGNEKYNSNKAFNDETFSQDKHEQTDRERKQSESRNSSTDTKGIGTNHTISEVIQKEVTLRREKWQDGIISEIVKSITISIYV